MWSQCVNNNTNNKSELQMWSQCVNNNTNNKSELQMWSQCVNNNTNNKSELYHIQVCIYTRLESLTSSTGSDEETTLWVTCEWPFVWIFNDMINTGYDLFLPILMFIAHKAVWF